LEFQLTLDFNDTTTVGLISGAVAFAIYMGCKLRQKTTPDFGEGVAVLLGGAGTMAGIQLCLLSLSKFACENASIEQNRTYVFLGGVAIMWTSVSTMWNFCKRNKTTIP
jgi:hypothetical protein